MNKIPPPNAVSKIAPPPIPAETRFPDDTKVKVAMKDGREIEAVIMEYNKGTKLFAVMWEEGNVAHFEFVSAEQLTRVPTDEERGKVIPFTRGRIAKNLPPPVPPSEVKTTAVPPPVPKSEAEQALQELLDMNKADEKDKERVKNVDILNGVKAKSLYEGRKTYDVKNEQTGSALEVVAATYEGYEYPKNHNEDRVVIDPDTGMFTVIDGMGGGDNGELAASVLAESIKKLPPAEAVRKAKEQMAAKGLDGKKDGAVCLSAKIKVGQPIDVVQAGDVDLFHFDSDSNFKFRPLDRLKMKDVNGQPMPPQSAFEFFMSDQYTNSPIEAKYKMIEGDLRKTLNLTDENIAIMKERAKHNEPLLRPGEPPYYTLRSRTGNAITSAMCEPLRYKTNSEVKIGDVIILMSDGVSVNFAEDELRSFVIEVTEKQLTAERATEILSHRLHERMKEANPTNNFKRDNASVVVIFVNKLKAQEEAKKSRAV